MQAWILTPLRRQPQPHELHPWDLPAQNPDVSVKRATTRLVASLGHESHSFRVLRQGLWAHIFDPLEPCLTETSAVPQMSHFMCHSPPRKPGGLLHPQGAFHKASVSLFPIRPCPNESICPPAQVAPTLVSSWKCLAQGGTGCPGLQAGSVSVTLSSFPLSCG